MILIVDARPNSGPLDEDTRYPVIPSSRHPVIPSSRHRVIAEQLRYAGHFSSRPMRRLTPGPTRPYPRFTSSTHPDRIEIGRLGNAGGMTRGRFQLDEADRLHVETVHEFVVAENRDPRKVRVEDLTQGCADGRRGDDDHRPARGGERLGSLRDRPGNLRGKFRWD